MVLARVKDGVLSLLPTPIRNKLRLAWSRRYGFEREYRGLGVKETFDKIYEEGIWGHDARGNPSSGPGSHDGNIIEPYIEAVSRFLSELGQDIVVVDLGCGDFNVGRKFIDKCKKFIACDVSEIIVNRNRETYAGKPVEFRVVNITEDELPGGDVAFVRQVLQHLSNRDILSFVERIRTEKPYRYLVVTEQLPDVQFKPNIDRHVGPSTRLWLGSGVDIGLPPFNMPSLEVRGLCTVRLHDQSLLQTTVYRLR